MALHNRTPAVERFKSGDIIRYGSGVSALFRYEGTHNAGRLYGSHVLGGAHGASDALFFDLRPASPEDILYCKLQRPEWFASPADRPLRHEPMNTAAREAVRIADAYLPRAPMKRRQALAKEIVTAISKCEAELADDILRRATATNTGRGKA